MNIDFGWVLPVGEARMPAGEGPAYGPHLRRVIDMLRPGFHSLWIPDHFMFDHWNVPEAMTTLSYLAGITADSDLRLGPIVLCQSIRNPALLAKMAATSQQLSGGRFILGIGAGWKEDEYRAYGYEFPPTPVRIAQMAEVIQICRALWDPDQSESTFRGQYYQIQAAVCNPKPDPAPPIMVGGGGEKLTLRVVAERADWWNIPGVTPDGYAHKLEVLAGHCAAVGRDPASIRKTWMGTVSVAPTRQQAERKLEGFPMWPGDVPLVGTPDDVGEQLQQFIDLGVSGFQLAFADEPSLDGMALFASEVIPRWNES